MSGPGQSTLKRTIVQASRPHDNIYDPLFESSSGVKGHIKQYNANMMKRLERVPNYEHMFSDHRQTHGIRVKSDKFNVPVVPPESAQKIAASQDAHTIIGRDRLKFVKRPNVPFLHNVPPQIIVEAQAPKRAEKKYTSAKEMVKLATPRVKTVAVQTLYRDSETQTDPYTPDYILSDDAPDPEVLSIAHFTYANGMLPVATHEVEVINRMREKKAYLATLPEDTDEASLEKRKQMLAKQEKKEWKYREQEMLKEQDAKLRQLMEKLRERDAKAQDYLNRRLDKLKQAKLKIRNDQLSRIHHQRVKGFRKLGKEDPYLTNKKTKRDVIGEYADHESHVYAPVARVGRAPMKNHVVDYGIPLIQDFQGLMSLESRIPSELEAKIRKPKEKTTFKRREQIKKDHLEHVDRIIHGLDADPSETQMMQNMYKTLQPTIRPHTPEIGDDEKSEIRSATVMIQKLIRGRAVQNQMYEEKVRSLPLIRELRIKTEAPQKDPNVETEKHLAAGIDLISGSIISHTLAFMAKHMLQQRENKSVIDLAKEALSERSRREEEESTRRKSESAVFNKLDQATGMIVGVHQNTVDSFIDNLLTNAVDELAHDSASTAIQDQDGKVGKTSGENNRAIVSDLVRGFLIPEVERQRKKNALDMKDSRYTRAAHDAMVDTVKEIHSALVQAI
uniref:Cilia- and flagella-associated protein 91 n=1 Tax=Lotharella globosa TaxID=91324 RepID=A0A6V3KV76_9EUKA|mmetsp:Transcript_7764/g.15149  ORF Transcript_7764/g.15149 Transcript_7764/m.15149 type:complete len:674 (+) Transcript_7764:86-2107(+)|eukprot:CAMPEP_0167819722 /NCGR_PEP_ID=MMETSP0112_2-20121227/5588_1 /TAXON_ID=91324 /ORGANISM="Lotharella globosa, Strain CCCM811" /LENGTH=673 /DNA_ID=CAMNT_0007719989 /DNA_START=198 /DNA_END=2219 /DNA_ORIENTATION=-